MGLKDDIQNAVSAAFDTDLADAVQVFVLLRKGPYDPVTQTPGSWDEIGQGRGVLSPVSLRGAMQRIPDSAINTDDQELICLQNEMSVEPKPRDRIYIAGKTYIIEAVFSDPVAATYTMWLKLAGTD